MPDYEKSMMMEVPAAQVFDFVTDVSNMPSYLPTTRNAQQQGAERVRVQGEAKGHQYDSDGYLRKDDRSMRMEWGADERHYKGWLQVEEHGGHSHVTVHLSFADQQGIPARNIEEGLEKALQSIKNHVEGRGGKEEPRSAH